MITEHDLMGRWTATHETGPLDHGSNFSNWLDVSATKGYILLSIDKEKEHTVMHVGLPVASYYGNNATSHISIYSGRLEIRDTELLLWHNPNVPTRINYVFANGVLSLNLFDTAIDLKKD